MASEKKMVFAVLGADARQRAAADHLRQQGWQVVGRERLNAADVILLPMPLSGESEELVRLLAGAKPGVQAFGGRVGPAARQAAAQAGIPLRDYLEREELAVLNAVPTAEGCIALLLQNRTRTLWNSPVLVLGYGRCGAALAVRLAALGARVTVAARSPGQRAQAESQALTACGLDRLAQLLPGFETVVNTIPAPVLDRRTLAALAAGSLVIDLASLPGGVDLEAAEALGVRAIRALSLPARCAPVTAGEFVADTVLAMLREEGVCV
ncbi:NAD(P)-dependent oxidoreductase [Allofournierella sp. CML151]|uniref:NAD(P)-dependent oxidoreductase n=1 Tax=Allofournierella sp. CML151 TaxID=2998082 RepID=UPI0022EB7BF6|nr:NAD(P)-dependent oxidoreductase [Fournierella sp. CML151]